MKIIIFILVFIVSIPAFAHDTWQVATRFSDAQTAATYCQTSFGDRQPPVPFKMGMEGANTYTCETNSNPCDVPYVWDQISYSCRLPCTQAPLGNITTQTQNFLVCVNGCEVHQDSESNCSGIGDSGSCTAAYSTTGAFCPNASTQPTISDGAPSTAQTGGGTPTGGDPGGGPSGGGPGGGPGGDQGGGSSSSSGSNSSTPSDPNGSGGTGTNGNNLTKGDVKGAILEALGQSVHGETCDAPPTCTAESSTVCNQLMQEYYLRCPHTPLKGHGDGTYDPHAHSLDIGARLQDAKDRYRNKVNELQGALQNSVHAAVSSGGVMDCPTYHIFGVTVTGGICSLSSFFDRLGGLFPAVASVLAAYILLRRD